jgi:hypothetical protein
LYNPSKDSKGVLTVAEGHVELEKDAEPLMDCNAKKPTVIIRQNSRRTQ